MAETFKVGANARELLRYTQRATRIVTDDISRSDARKIIQKVAALEDVRGHPKAAPGYLQADEEQDQILGDGIPRRRSDQAGNPAEL